MHLEVSLYTPLYSSLICFLDRKMLNLEMAQVERNVTSTRYFLQEEVWRFTSATSVINPNQ